MTQLIYHEARITIKKGLTPGVYIGESWCTNHMALNGGQTFLASRSAIYYGSWYADNDRYSPEMIESIEYIDKEEG